MLDLYKLQIFSLVVQEGSFSGAADILLMSQSGVSQHIQELEKGLGTTLFNRERRGVSLTLAGATLHDYTQRLLQLAGEAENAVTDVNKLKNQHVAISATPGISIYLMPEWSREFRATYPNLSVSLQTGITSQVIDNVHKRRSDIGIVEGELDDLNNLPIQIAELQTIEQYVVIGEAHPWWQRDDIVLEELDGQSMIMRHTTSQTRRWLEQILQTEKIAPQVVAEFDNLESIKRSVISGTCLTILPDYTVRQEQQLGLMKIISITESPLQRTLKLIWSNKHLISPGAQAFTSYLKALFTKIAN